MKMQTILHAILKVLENNIDKNLSCKINKTFYRWPFNFKANNNIVQTQI